MVCSVTKWNTPFIVFHSWVLSPPLQKYGVKIGGERFCHKRNIDMTHQVFHSRKRLYTLWLPLLLRLTPLKSFNLALKTYLTRSIWKRETGQSFSLTQHLRTCKSLLFRKILWFLKTHDVLDNRITAQSGRRLCFCTFKRKIGPMD